ncbi:MAG: hypothetical protein P1P84_25455, partial [Deferrisomatales bacterium]|nr:hypothetical protein [Deferrisomatales bacterium]
MADEQPTAEERPGSTAEPEAPAPGQDEEAALPGKPPRRGPWLAVLVLIGLVVALEVAGLLLRDPLERRLPVLAEAPAVMDEDEGGTGST